MTLLMQHTTPAATRTLLESHPSACVWREKQTVAIGVERAIPAVQAGFDRAENPM